MRLVRSRWTNSRKVQESAPSRPPDGAADVPPAPSAAGEVGATKDRGWIKFGGRALESALGVVADMDDSPVKLVDGRFLVKLTRSGSLMRRRQELPVEAFVSLSQLQRMQHGSGGSGAGRLRIVVISHPWLQPDHCDPRGDNLRLIARAVEALMEAADSVGGTVGVFLDFMSLHQKDRMGQRTPSEAALFGLALGGLSEWYSHPCTFVFKITQLPAGYPDGFDFPAGSSPNQADYDGRGWCFCESSLANLVKSSEMVLDLGKLGAETVGFSQMQRQCAAGRLPPLSPVAFWEHLQAKAFTSRKADLPTVQSLYAAAFSTRLAAAETLDFGGLGWQDRDLHTLAATLREGAMPRVVQLLLYGNRFTGHGIADALVPAIAAGALGSCTSVNLGSNAIDAFGMAALAAVVEGGGLPACTDMLLGGNPADDTAVQRALVESRRVSPTMAVPDDEATWLVAWREERGEADPAAAPYLAWPRDHLQLGAVIGTGCSGRVFDAVHAPSGQQVALKHVKARSELAQAYRELQIWRRVAHGACASLVATYTAFLCDDGLELLMERMGPSLADVTAQRDERLQDEAWLLRSVALPLLSALSHLHTNLLVVHRDVKVGARLDPTRSGLLCLCFPLSVSIPPPSLLSARACSSPTTAACQPASLNRRVRLQARRLWDREAACWSRGALPHSLWHVHVRLA